MSEFAEWFMPKISDGTLDAFRIGYGVLLLVFLGISLRFGRRFFLSERWGGFGQSSPFVDVLQNPIVYPLVAVSWIVSALGLMCSEAIVASAAINFAFCRYFFVQMRWRGAARGMGAPGFMTYWIGGAVLVLEYSRNFAPTILPFAVLTLQVDFALIMFSAGIYKLTAGYSQNQGMEFGLVSPAWGYWGRIYERLAPDHWMYRSFNQLAWSTEVVAAALMLWPSTRMIGALIIMGSFVYVGTQIRLGVLPLMVILCGVIFLPSESFASHAFESFFGAKSAAIVTQNGGALRIANAVLHSALWIYLFLLPAVHAGLFYNFYGRKSLPPPLQRALETYANAFGIIIWRVFSSDITSFYVEIYRRPRCGGPRELLSHYGRLGSRFNFVAESIAIACVFTTLRYYSNNTALFTERLLRYARTIPCDRDSVLVFEYRNIVKSEDRFERTPVVEFVVDLAASSVEERALSGAAAGVRRPCAKSPVHEGLRPGSYVALRT